MVLSNELQSQVTRFSKTRSCSMDSQLKNELALLLFQIKGTRLNKSCGTCIRNAMQDLINFIQNDVKLTEFIGIRHERANGPVKSDTKGDVKTDTKGDDSKEAAALLAQLNKMSYKELKAYAGVKGNIKREKIYQLIHLSK